MEKTDILSKLVDKYEDREAQGFLKYGTTMDRGDLSLHEWLNHLQEELMDATLYITKLKEELRDEIEEAAIDTFSEEPRKEYIVDEDGKGAVVYRGGKCESISASWLYPGDLKITYDKNNN